MSRLTKYELPFNLKTAKALGVSRSPKALDVRYWHKADIPDLSINVRYWG